MKSNIKILAFIMLIASIVTKPSDITNKSQTIDWGSMPKSNQTTSPMKTLGDLLINFTKETAENDALNNNKKGRFVYKVALNNLSELKNILSQKSLILSEEVENKLYELYQNAYKNTEIDIKSQSSLPAASTFQIDIASSLRPQQTNISNKDLIDIQILLHNLSNTTEKMQNQIFPYSIQYLKYLQSLQN